MKSMFERSYIDLLRCVVLAGSVRNDRTGVGTRAIFASQISHNWNDGFPLITHRVLNHRPACAEMACFIRGHTEIEDFENMGCKWWRQNLEDFNKRNNCPNNTNLGPIYGSKWRDFHGIDQLIWLLAEAKNNPHSRRLLVSSWDPSDQAEAVLPPCHYSWQIFIEDGWLDMTFAMRSVDVVLGMPSDFVAYAFLQLAICRHLGLEPRELTGTFADTHVYLNHLDGVETMLNSLVERELPSWGWKKDASDDMFSLLPTDLLLSAAEQGPSIKFAMAV